MLKPFIFIILHCISILYNTHHFFIFFSVVVTAIFTNLKQYRPLEQVRTWKSLYFVNNHPYNYRPPRIQSAVEIGFTSSVMAHKNFEVRYLNIKNLHRLLVAHFICYTCIKQVNLFPYPPWNELFPRHSKLTLF